MAEYALKFVRQCSGGEHVVFNLVRDGININKVYISKTEMLNSDVDVKDALVYLMRKAIKDSGAKTDLQLKNTVESIRVSL